MEEGDPNSIRERGFAVSCTVGWVTGGASAGESLPEGFSRGAFLPEPEAHAIKRVLKMLKEQKAANKIQKAQTE